MEGLVKIRKPGGRPTRPSARRGADGIVIAESALDALRHDIANPLMAICASAELILRQDKGLTASSVQRLRQVLASCDDIGKILARARRPPRLPRAARPRSRS